MTEIRATSAGIADQAVEYQNAEVVAQTRAEECSGCCGPGCWGCTGVYSDECLAHDNCVGVKGPGRCHHLLPAAIWSIWSYLF